MSSDRVIDYYSQCYADYRRFWGVEKNLSIHYGFHDRKHRSHGDALTNMNRVLARICRIKPGDTILDAGCGIGGSAIWLAKSFGVSVTGINIHEMQIEIAREMAIRNNADDLVKFTSGDFTNTRFFQNSFDVVWALESICYAEKKRDFLCEAKRILKNKGRIVVADGFLKKAGLTENEKDDVDRWLGGWAVPNLASVDEFRKYLEELNFRNIGFTEITKNVMPSSKRMFATGVLTYLLGKSLELVGIRTRTQTNHIVAIFYQHLTLRRGLWTYGIFDAEK